MNIAPNSIKAGPSVIIPKYPTTWTSYGSTRMKYPRYPQVTVSSCSPAFDHYVHLCNFCVPVYSSKIRPIHLTYGPSKKAKEPQNLTLQKKDHVRAEVGIIARLVKTRFSPYIPQSASFKHILR